MNIDDLVRGSIDMHCHHAPNDLFECRMENLLRKVNPLPQSSIIPNMDRAAEFLNNLPAIWSRAGVTNKQRELLLSRVFEEVYIE